jgi:hypothetical protein
MDCRLGTAGIGSFGGTTFSRSQGKRPARKSPKARSVLGFPAAGFEALLAEGDEGRAVLVDADGFHGCRAPGCCDGPNQAEQNGIAAKAVLARCFV